MKAIEFPIKIKSDRKITVPRKYNKDIRPNQNARIIILLDENEAEKEWNELSLKQFFKGYNDKDSAYDNM